MLIDIHTHKPKKLINTKEIFVFDFSQNINHRAKQTCYGIHPWFIEKLNIDEVFNKIENQIIENNYFALGEIGLDRTISTPLESQIDIFEKQLQLVHDYQVDRIVLHNVKASFDIIPILDNFNINCKILLHDYNENLKVFDSFSKKFDTFFSTGHQLFRESTIQKSLNQLPLQKLFLESDDQETYNIINIYKRCAKILNLDQTTLEEKLFENFNNFSS